MRSHLFNSREKLNIWREVGIHRLIWLQVVLEADASSVRYSKSDIP